MSLSKAGRGTQFQRGNGADPEVFTTVAELTKCDMSNGKADVVDVTNFDSGVYHEKLPTLIDWGEVTLEGNYLGNQNAAQQELFTDFTGQVLRDWKIVLPSGINTISFSGYITQPPSPAISPEKAMTFSMKITITGAVTIA